jgi:hypothetical protein
MVAFMNSSDEEEGDSDLERDVAERQTAATVTAACSLSPPAAATASQQQY